MGGINVTGSQSSIRKRRAFLQSQLHHTNIKKGRLNGKANELSRLPSEIRRQNELDKERDERLVRELSKQEKLVEIGNGDSEIRIFDDSNFTFKYQELESSCYDDEYDEPDDDDRSLEEKIEDDPSLQVVLNAIDMILGSKYDNGFPVKKGGITNNMKNHIIVNRLNQPNLLILNQLYSVFRYQETLVDLKVSKLIKIGKLKKFNININNGLNQFFLIVIEDYLKVIEDTKQLCKDPNEIKLLEKFEEFITKYSGIVTDFNEYELVNNYNLDPKTLVKLGFLTILNAERENVGSGKNNNRLNRRDMSVRDEIEERLYQLSIPNIGLSLKPIKDSINFIVKLLSKKKFKEDLQIHLNEKYTYNNSKWVKFNGMNLNFALSICLGLGVVEVFQTPMGLGWKLTGKNL